MLIDTGGHLCESKPMNTSQAVFPDALLTDLHAAAQEAATGARDSAAMKEAKKRMELMREEIFRRHGLLGIGVPAIRELRDAQA